MTALDFRLHLPRPSRTRLRHQRTAGLLVPLAVGGVLATFLGSPAVLLNTTPSEPQGVYVRAFQPPGVGRIIAFRMPAPGLAYVDEAMPYLRHRPLLKAVAAGPGDTVCTRGGELVVNGARLGPIAGKDRHGATLPHWIACRRLGPDELFVFSARVPNSFDSRYYGPVSRTAVLGVYRHLDSTLRRGA